MTSPLRLDHRHRLQLTYDLTPKETKSFLDIGCGDGTLLIHLRKKLPHSRLIGFDVDLTRLQKTNKVIKSIKFIKSLNSLGKETFDVISLLEVIEHVPSEKKTLQTVYNLLKPNGILLLSTPNKGLTQVFDPGNIKFRFPLLHKFLYTEVFKQTDYEEKYLSGSMVGDVSRQKKMWHRHYNLKELEKITKGKFLIQKVLYYGMFLTIFSMIDQSFAWLTGKHLGILRRITLIDSRLNFGKFSFSIFIKGVKI